jgi:hypothetical protein
MAKFKILVKDKMDLRRPSPLADMPLPAEPEVPTLESKNRAIDSERLHLYGRLHDQLDMLWHDIDNGKIQADTTSANTWYQHIKEVKIDHPYLVANTAS